MIEDDAPNVLAKRIADELLTMFATGEKPEVGTRLQIIQMQKDGIERNLGGRNRTSIIRVIESHLQYVEFNQ